MSAFFSPALQTLRGTLRPREFFARTDLRTLFRGTGIIVAALVFLLILTALVNAEAIANANHSMASYARGEVAIYSNPGALGHLTYPLLWGLIVLYAAGIRHGFMALIAEQGRSFAGMVGTTTLACLPLMIGGALQGSLNNLFPTLPMPDQSSLPYVRIYGGFALLVLGCGWEGYISISSLRGVFSQPIGRAILTWLTPVIAAMVWFPILYLVLVMLGGD